GAPAPQIVLDSGRLACVTCLTREDRWRFLVEALCVSRCRDGSRQFQSRDLVWPTCRSRHAGLFVSGFPSGGRWWIRLGYSPDPVGCMTLGSNTTLAALGLSRA